MKIYRSLKSIPELVDLPEEKHKEIWKECDLTNLERTAAFWKLLAFPFILIGMKLGKICGGKIGSIVGIVIGGVIGVIVVQQIAVYIVRSRVRKNLLIYKYKYGSSYR